MGFEFSAFRMKPFGGMIVCDCKYDHLKVVEILDDNDTLILEDGNRCSFTHCCDTVPHPEWEHPRWH